MTNVQDDGCGNVFIDGHHTETPEKDGKLRYNAYKYEFTGISLRDLRMSANVLDVLTANRTGASSASKGKTCDVFFTLAVHLACNPFATVFLTFLSGTIKLTARRCGSLGFPPQAMSRRRMPHWCGNRLTLSRSKRHWRIKASGPIFFV